MKVAFATQDLSQVDAHFGWAKHIAVYELTPDGHRPLRTFTFGGTLNEDGNEDKLGPKIEAIKDCALLYVADIGGSAAARVVANRVHPIKAARGESIADLLERLRQVLRGTPPPWLRKALQKDRPREFEIEAEAHHG